MYSILCERACIVDEYGRDIGRYNSILGCILQLITPFLIKFPIRKKFRHLQIDVVHTKG